MRKSAIVLALITLLMAMLPGIVIADPPSQHENPCGDSDEINGWAFVISGKGNGVYSIDFVSENGEIPITNWDLRTVHDTAELGSPSSVFSAMINNPTFSGVYTPIVTCDHSRSAYSDSPPIYALPSAHIGTVTFTVDPGAVQDGSDDFYWDITQGGAGHQTERLLSAAVLAANGHLIVWCGDAGMPDECPTDPDKTEPGTCGCGVADTDSDSDGTPDCNDECPTDPNKVAPGTCGCGVADADTDSDGDGTPDCNDECPTDASKVAPGICGCGVADTDSDSDGTADCNDGCPTDPAKTSPGTCGCGVADTDSDSDGTLDCNDECPTDPNKVAPGTCGCGVADTDTDGDGTLDCLDGCPADPNKIAAGACGCGVADTDSDGDSTADCLDGCPADPNKTAAGACGCGVADTDSDGDGTADCLDGCPADPNKIAAGACGCGVADTDSDGDSTSDCSDECPNDANKVVPGVCGCGVADTDTDGDGTVDCNDGCPTDGNKVAPGVCGCGVADTDTDGDGTLDCNDGCPTDPAKTAAGICGCGVADTDTDGDNTPDCDDNCPADPAKTESGICGCGVSDVDSDNDGTLDCDDNCPYDANAGQEDADNDGIGDVCEGDQDSDGVPDDNDGCPTDPNKIAAGACGCGVADTDTDGDGTLDCNDGCPNDGNKVAPGTCGCGVADTDTDSDGILDCNDGCPTDANKIAPGTCGCGVADTDTDSDNTPDCNDGCPNDPSKVAPGVCGCGVADTDTDADGTLDCNDGCPTDPAKTAAGICGCGVADTDTDADGTLDCNDGCATDPNKVALGGCGCGVADADTDTDGTLDCNDCDANDASVWQLLKGYVDADEDTYGIGSEQDVCSGTDLPTGYVTQGGDCDDGNIDVNPGATEACNGIDDDCDEEIDEGVKITFYRDADGDTYGDPETTVQACSQPEGYVTDNTDCDDTKAAVHPGATELCNGVDDDCDGVIDDGLANLRTYYRDVDGDGYGNSDVSVQACGTPAGYVRGNGDCDDNNASVNPGVTETCNGVDDDCDIEIDEWVKTTFYRDADGDTYGDPNTTTQACSQPAGYVTNDTDCDDTKASVYPNAAEVCNGTDDDCDGQIDEGVKSTFYRDADCDGYGNPNTSVPSCSAPTGYVSNNTDCSDSNASIHPGATEICNSLDDDCDGQIDEGLSCGGGAPAGGGGNAVASISINYTLTIAVGSTGGGTTRPAPGTYSYPGGTVVSVGATANEGYGFVNWSGDASGTSSTIRVTLDRDKTITANFAEVAPTPTPTPEATPGTAQIPPPTPEGNLSGKISPEGVVTEDVALLSEDGDVLVQIPAGTGASDANGDPLADITFEPLDAPPPPPDGEYVILPYDLGPDGATFNPPITVTVTYDPGALPEGVTEENLILAYYDPTTGQWVELGNIIVDPVNNTISGTISHFTVCAILAKAEAPASTSEAIIPATAEPASEATQEPTPASTPAEDDGGSPTNVPLISGIAVAGAAALATVLFFTLRRRKGAASGER